jgi:hypothetical protein
MSPIVLLDSNPVGLITNPKATPLAIECQQWLNSLLGRGYHVVLPEKWIMIDEQFFCRSEILLLELF